MLDRYIGECMVLMININNDIKKPTRVYQNCNTSQILIFGGYLKVKESLYDRVIIWVNTILNQTGTRTNLSRYEGSCMVNRIQRYRKLKYPQTPILCWYPKCEILIIDTRYVLKKDDTSPILEITNTGSDTSI